MSRLVIADDYVPGEPEEGYGRLVNALSAPRPYMRLFRCIALDTKIKQREEEARFYRTAGLPITAAGCRAHAASYEAEIQRRLREVCL